MADFEKWLEIGNKLGYTGAELREFVKTQQDLARDERQREREAEKEARLEREREKDREEKRILLEIEEKQKERQHQLEMKKLEVSNQTQGHNDSGDRSKSKAKIPRLPEYKEGKDSMDAYLERFERYADSQKWLKEDWAINLSALLTGKSLDVYSRMPQAFANDYTKLKEALLKRYQLTDEGFRLQFREAKADEGETPAQFIVRINMYLDRWIELSGTKKDFKGIKDLMVREQFLSICDKNLSTYLKEKPQSSLDELAKNAEHYLEAHGKHLGGSHRNEKTGHEQKKVSNPVKRCHYCDKIGHLIKDCKLKNQDKVCFRCNKVGHIANECTSQGSNPKQYNNGYHKDLAQNQNVTKTCFLCGRNGHVARDCRAKGQVSSALTETQTQETDSISKSKFDELMDAMKLYFSDKYTDPECQEKASVCMIPNTPEMEASSKGSCDCVGEDEIKLQCGKTLPLVTGLCKSSDVDLKFRGKTLPVLEGYIGNILVKTLRDTGCTGVVVKKQYVKPEEYTGKNQTCMMIDGSIIQVPIAKINVDTPYLVGTVEAMCMEHPVYDLVIGNVDGARSPDDPCKDWCQTSDKACVLTRSQKESLTKTIKPLFVGTKFTCEPVTVEDFISLQKEDKTLDKVRSAVQQKVKGGNTVWYEHHCDILYRYFQNKNTIHKQVVVPKSLRQKVMSLAHDSILAGHMGIGKTTRRVMSCFYWPGLQGDIKRYCQSCDICQRTIPKGKVSKIPLGKMPTIDVPFKRVAVDLVGPIFPLSESGKRYILTIVDYATRYPEAIALKNITTESVAEALIEVFSRVGMPEEILSDMGGQFTSMLMKEISRLLSIKQLTTTPYHPICNGLVEKMNGTLKMMLRKLASEKPKDWDRYLPALLFAYREVPNVSTGFSPFELLYGRSVRGPLQILKQCWTNDDISSDIKSTYQYVVDLKQRLEDTCKVAQQELCRSQTRYEKYYNKKARSRKYKKGDLVLILLPTDNNKLLLQWKGPYKVEECMSPYDYKIDVKGSIKCFHANMLKRYLVRDSKESGSVLLCCAGTHEIKEVEYSEFNDSDLFHFSHSENTDIKDVHIGDKLNEIQRAEILNIVSSFPDVFTENPGSTTVEQHRIDLTTDEPVRAKVYPLPFAVQEEVCQEIDKMLELGVIEPSNSPYVAPIVLVRKKDGTNRICIDFRQLNMVTIFDPEPMPRADDIYAKLADKRYFTKFDLSKGYWQIPLTEDSKDKTSFVCPGRGKFRFVRMPFGLVCAAATFNRMMRKVLQGITNVDSYIDDVLVFTKTWSEHVHSVQQVLTRLREVGLTIKPKKCFIGFDKLDYIGHEIGQGQMWLQSDNVEKIQKAPRPTTKKTLRSFIGLINYYRNYVPNFASIAEPLTNLTRKKQPNILVWSDAQEEAFSKLKQILLDKPVLQLPNFNKGFILQTDASDVGLGAALLQEHNDLLLPIAYASRKLLPREKAYSVIEKECLAVVWAVQKFHVYLYGTEFILQTDHQPLVCMGHKRMNNDRLMRWSLLLQPYRMHIQAIPGSQNVFADYLSRC